MNDEANLNNSLKNNFTYSLSELQKIILDILKDYPIKKIILLGSYANNTATKNSDIDLINYSNISGNSELEKEVKEKDIIIFEKII